MVSLNFDIMGFVLEYMDNQSLARISQTSTAWRSVVYRTSVWQTWKPKARTAEYFYTNLSIPKDSHHNGEPTRLCFFSWATYILRHNILYDIPRGILAINNPVKFVDALYEFWSTQGQPCIHTNHHKWSHVFKNRSQIRALEMSEIERIGYRTTEFPTSHDTNPYRFWLMSYINSILPIHIGAIPSPTDTTDILAVIYYNTKKVEYERFVEIGKRQEEHIEKFTHSIRMLAPLPTVEFTRNQRAFQKNRDAILNTIVFTLPQDPLRLAISESSSPVEPLGSPDAHSPL